MATLPQQVREAREVEEEERPASVLGLLRDVVQSVTNIVEDSTELVAATIREELTRFRVELARNAVGGVAALAGVALLSAGIAIYLSELLGSWPLTLAILGAVYLGLGFALMTKKK